MGQQRTSDGIPLASCRTTVAQPCMFQPVAQTVRLHGVRPSPWDHGVCRKISFSRSVISRC
jgi:hypothetical protein